MKNFYQTYIVPHQRPILTGLFLMLTVFRVFLFLRTPLAASAEPTSDDWNLLNQAWSLQNGEWLGAYQDSTLSYGIAFPLFVMLCNKLCIPFMMAVALIYIGSILYFLYTWKTLLPSRLIRGILYLAFLYSPVMMTVYTAQRAWDFTLVPSLILLLLALSYRVYQHRKNHMFSWILAFGILFTFFCYLRKTNYWLFPLFLGFVIFLGRQLKKDRLCRQIPLLLTPVVMILVTGLGISLLNFHYYQKFTVYTPSEGAVHTLASPSGVLKDTLYTAFHMSANQMTDADTHPGSGSRENLRFIESLTGSLIIYPDAAAPEISSWIFSADDGSGPEQAVASEHDIRRDPALYATQKVVKVSKFLLLLHKILGIPAMILAAISYIGISFSLKSGNKIFQRWIFLTGIGASALLSLILSCARYPSFAGFDPAAYASGAWMLIQVFMALCIVWFIRPLRLGKKSKKK